MDKQHGSARLVGVMWDGDRGVVNLDTAEVVMYCFGKLYGSYFYGPYFDIKAGDVFFHIPYVEIEDEDFLPLIAEEDAENDAEDDLDYEALSDVANWDNVVALLTLPSFKLADKLTYPGTGKRTRV